MARSSYVVSTFFLIFVFELHAKDIFMKCRQFGIWPKNSYKRNIYDKNEKIKGSEVITSELEMVWSNATKNLQEIFFDTSKSLKVPSVVEVSYFKFFKKSQHMQTKDIKQKLLYSKTFKLTKVRKDFFKIEGFKFNDHIMSPDNRPGVQIFTLKLAEEALCYSKIEHYFANDGG